MKLIHIFLSLLLIVLVGGCDQCKEVGCINGGDCNDGECLCPEGFTGENCQIDERCITRNVQCLNNTTCDNGECQCGNWYFGERCETKYTNQFLRFYYGSYFCNFTSTFLNTRVLESLDEEDGKLFFILDDQISFEVTMDPSLDGSFEIEDQTFVYPNFERGTISGSGVISLTSLQFTVTIVSDNGSFESCTFNGQ